MPHLTVNACSDSQLPTIHSVGVCKPTNVESETLLIHSSASFIAETEAFKKKTLICGFVAKFFAYYALEKHMSSHILRIQILFAMQLAIAATFI